MTLFVRWESLCGNRRIEPPAVKQAAEKVVIFVIPSEARNLSKGSADEKKKERFLASLGMTKSSGDFFCAA